MLKDQLVLIYFFPEEPQTMAALIHHTLEKAISLQYKYIHTEKILINITKCVISLTNSNMIKSISIYAVVVFNISSLPSLQQHNTRHTVSSAEQFATLINIFFITFHISMVYMLPLVLRKYFN